MDEEAASWIRRTNYSHTVCHRIDSWRLASVPVTVNQASKTSAMEAKPRTPPSDLNLQAERYVVGSKIQRNPITNKQRSVSPSPQMVLPDLFKEARSDRKRFSTPHPRRTDSEKGMKVRWIHKDSLEKSSFNLRSPSQIGPMRDLGTVKIQERVKSKKETGWTRYSDHHHHHRRHHHHHRRHHHGGHKVNAVEEYSIDMSKLFLGLKFAHGLYSRLYHGIYNDEAVAVKLITVPDDDDNGSLGARLGKQFTQEVTLLSCFRHPNVIKFIGACKDPPVYCIITEYLAEGSLRSYLHKLEKKTLPMQKLITFALDIARGMEYIHSQHVVHRDLKPENVLIDDDFSLKIADFGIACEEEGCDSLDDDPGTYRWMAPEMIKRKPYGRKADVYSFGLVLWEMVSGSIPYEHMNPIQAAFAVVHKNVRPEIPGDCPAAMRALIEQCWSMQPEKRPEFWQIVKVLQRFEASMKEEGGRLNLTLSTTHAMCRDHKKGLKHWIQKLGGGPTSPTSSSSMPKPKFT